MVVDGNRRRTRAVEEFPFVVVDAWGDPDSFPVRLRRLLKMMLRSYGLKVKWDTESRPDTPLAR
jgi:hypothetical protein